MPATNVIFVNPGAKVYVAADCYGTGAIAAPDELVTNLEKYPLGSRYFDNIAKKDYRRVGEARVIGDWVSGAAMV